MLGPRSFDAERFVSEKATVSNISGKIILHDVSKDRHKFE